jgi:hypothetical protein
VILSKEHKYSRTQYAAAQPIQNVYKISRKLMNEGESWHNVGNNCLTRVRDVKCGISLLENLS